MQTFHEFFGLTYNPVSKVVFLYPVALLLALFALFVINRLLRMPIGRAREALREDEIACRALGLNPTVIKLSAFTPVPASLVSPVASSPRAKGWSRRSRSPSSSRPPSSPSWCWAAWARSWAWFSRLS